MKLASADDFVVVLVSIGEKDGADLAWNIINENLAACVNVVPKVASYYKWQSAICQDSEQLLLIKTQKKLLII